MAANNRRIKWARVGSSVPGAQYFILRRYMTIYIDLLHNLLYQINYIHDVQVKIESGDAQNLTKS